MIIRSINSEILNNDTAIFLKNLFFIKGKIKLIKLSSVYLSDLIAGSDNPEVIQSM